MSGKGLAYLFPGIEPSCAKANPVLRPIALQIIE
jgi:hypothetical protein